MPSIDADVVLVAEGRDSQIDTRPAFFARLSLGVFDRPARVAVLLAQLGGVVRPLRRDAAFLDVALLAIRIALYRRGDNRGIDDLAAHRQEPGRGQCRIEPIEENLDRRFTANPRL